MRTGCTRNAEEMSSDQAMIVILNDPIKIEKLIKIKIYQYTYKLQKKYIVFMDYKFNILFIFAFLLINVS